MILGTLLKGGRRRWIAMLAVAGAVALAGCSTGTVAPEPERDAVAAAVDHYIATGC